MKLKVLTRLFATATGLLMLSSASAQIPPAVSPPSAQSEPPAATTPQERFNHLSEDLDLSDAQKPKVRAIFEQTRQQLQAAMQQVQSNAQAQLQDVLTPEQYQKFQSLWQPRKTLGRSPQATDASNPNHP
jgi:Spy/CpxP family protein refolding chaperone